MTDFVFSHDEKAIIEECIKKGHTSWNDDRIKDLKSRIKEFLKERQNHFCCYCLRNLNGEFNYVIDIEHILPKHKYIDFMFNFNNLAASCKRCNMKIKGRRIDFINSCFKENSNPFATENYKFVHPNTDNIVDHINYFFIQRGINILVSYSVKNNSPKGKYSIEFFKLEDLAIYMNNKAQGLSTEDEDYYAGNLEYDDVDDALDEKLMRIERIIGELAFKNDQV